MRFHPSAPSLSRAIITGVFSLAIIACSDSTTPRVSSELDPSRSIEVIVPDSVKHAYALAMAQAEEAESHGSMSLAPNRLAPSLIAGTSAGLRAYTKSRIPFAPEPAPANIVPDLTRDGLFQGIPIGFDFEFYGKVYNQFNLYMNGFITFDPNIPVNESGVPLGFWAAGTIPAPGTPNAIIALAWSDWQPNLVPGSIRYETRGSAPNRRFILQFTNVPEYNGRGRLTSQLVLEEGSNIVTINTASMTINGWMAKATQGIENGLGTQAVYDSVQNPTTLVWTPRNRRLFSLKDDAVRFYPPAPNKAPVVIAPPNISVDAAPGSCSAAAGPLGTATVSDDEPDAYLLAPVRADGLALDAPYPGGVTTIAWTAVDVQEARTTVNQLVTVNDNESPSITAPAGVSADNDPGMGSAVVATGSPVADDHCGVVSINGTRSDGAAMSAPYPVGLTTITWTASDAAGNVGSATQTVLVVDKEKPSINALDISLDATSRSGAIVNFVLETSDNVGVVEISCKPQESGSMFAAGRKDVTCTAKDAAGNEASDSFVVTVYGAAEQLAALIGSVADLDLSEGAGNPLLNQLRAALRAIEGESSVSCKKLEDFTRLVTEREKSMEIPSTEISAILVDVRRIEAVLGCQ